MKRRLAGGLTVEAAYVMATVLFSLAGLFKYSFRIHDEASAGFVMNEGLLIAGHSREPDLEAISEKGENRLKYSMYIKDIDLRLEGKGKKLKVEGFSDDYVKSMTDKGFEPEKIMRMITLIERVGIKKDED